MIFLAAGRQNPERACRVLPDVQHQADVRSPVQESRPLAPAWQTLWCLAHSQDQSGDWGCFVHGLEPVLPTIRSQPQDQTLTRVRFMLRNRLTINARHLLRLDCPGQKRLQQWESGVPTQGWGCLWQVPLDPTQDWWLWVARAGVEASAHLLDYLRCNLHLVDGIGLSVRFDKF